MRPEFGALAQLVLKHGFLKTQRGLIFLASVAVFMHKNPEVEPTIEALAEWWKQSERTTYRELAAWRAVSGGADHVEAARAVIASYDAAVLDEANVQALALDSASLIAAG